ADYEVDRRFNDGTKVVVLHAVAGLVKVLAAQEIFNDGLNPVVAGNKGVCHLCNDCAVNRQTCFQCVWGVDKETVDLPAYVSGRLSLAVELVYKLPYFIQGTFRCGQCAVQQCRIGTDNITVKAHTELLRIVVMRGGVLRITFYFSTWEA